MRLLAVTHAYPRFDGDVAGSFIERFCRALVERGHVVEVLAPSDEGRGGREERWGVTVERLRYATPDREVLAYRGTMAEAARSVAGLRAFAGLVSAYRRAVIDRARRRQADLVHAHWWVPGGIGAWRARRAAGVPYVVTLHGTDVAILRRSAVARALGRRVLRRADAVTAVSAYLAETAARMTGLSPDRIAVHPMPAEVGAPDTPAAAGAPDVLRVVTVGRLTTQKRVRLLLEAVRELAARGTTVTCTVVGDGPERASLERLAADLGIGDRARFVGSVSPGEVPAHLAAADVFAFPAEREGFGLAVAEALIAGLPVVACSDGGGVTDMVVEGAGRLVPPDDPRAFAVALEEIGRDGGARQRASAAGADWQRRLAPAAVAEAYEAVYRQILRGGNA